MSAAAPGLRDEDVDWINDAAKPLCLALAPRRAADLAVAIAEEVDRRVAALSEDFITRNAAVRLVDFDLAQPQPEHPKKFSKNPGTPAYMAPEQLQREAYDHRVDVFAYGVTAYELLTGQKPFPGDTPEDILRKQLDRSGFVAPRQINEGIPPAVEKSILKCLERDPDKRHPIMSVLVLELKAALYV